jgi:hypothetical protein
MIQVAIKQASQTVEPCILNEPSESDGSEVLNDGAVQRASTNCDGKKLPLTLRNLPKGLRELLDSCPAEGQGVHRWLFKTALRLHQYFPEWEIEEILKANLRCNRPGREILEAVANFGRIFRGEVLWRVEVYGPRSITR